MKPQIDFTRRLGRLARWRLAMTRMTMLGVAAALPLQGALAQAMGSGTGSPGAHPMAIRILLILMLIVVALLMAFTCRHYVFTFARLFGQQRQPYLDIESTDWPSVVVFVPAHNEEKVIADSLAALLAADYPPDKYTIMPVNDRSSDGTRAAIDRIALAHPGQIHPFHRTAGMPGKAAALLDATALVKADIIVVFDADYLPAKGLIKQLVAPFVDPEVGAVMGRVVPLNVGKNLLTRLLDLERAGGYQVSQAARMNLGLVPQYGGTVGSVRRSALEDIGGWHTDMLAEDTDVTFRLLQRSWKTVYQNRSECYEEVPQAWGARIGQIARWGRGHNQVMYRNLHKTIFNADLQPRERMDGAMLLAIFSLSPVLLLGWALAVALYFLSPSNWILGWIGLFALVTLSAAGNNAAFFEIATATYLDGHRNRIRLLPLSMFCFLISLVTISRASVQQVVASVRGSELIWHKTERFRSTEPGPDSAQSDSANRGPAA